MSEQDLTKEQGKRENIPHDEAFKKLLQTFFAEFIELFFPHLDLLLDHTHTRLLMQELLVDIVGEEARSLDLLIETRYRSLNAYILIHLEPQSYWQEKFNERMFIYFSRLFERHRKEHRLIIPIAIFTSDAWREEPDTYSMAIPDHEIVRFQFLKVELKKHNWRRFVDSDNPVAAALLAKMGYNKKEKREMRSAYLRMILRMRKKLDDAKMALIMSVADLYFEPDREQDEQVLRELLNQYPEEGDNIMELMPAWKRWGYEEGIEEGLEKGKAEERKMTVRKLLAKGFSDEQIAETLEISLDEIKRLARH
ncbi:Rpn family recombination-promoting nuclease/putative transposase [Cohnella herbarum]|uniref:Rpn family recombination-promoting nuclease/putative transposase n=1 Tax=Cohnella herbarum TaxID=2728023 RepID=A0A7Z2VQZ0_9BACL|nr:Rpn family recombination-promoting nuclease/putative transposase [Cohnella herbarum]QJD87583.1 Rpn family recombination-promoting nuclease/putative transposase [Cohnella herbarum]